MSGKFCGEFEVSKVFADEYVMGDWGDAEVGSWLLVRRVRDGGLVHIAAVEYNHAFAAYSFKRVYDVDVFEGLACDYELWHVAYIPDFLVDVIDDEIPW